MAARAPFLGRKDATPIVSWTFSPLKRMSFASVGEVVELAGHTAFCAARDHRSRRLRLYHLAVSTAHAAVH